MKKRYLLAFMLTAIIGGSCSKEDRVSINTQDQVAADRMKWLKISPSVNASDNAQYTWTWGNDTIGTSRNLMYAFDSTGNFSIQLTVTSGNSVLATKSIQVNVSAPATSYKNAVTKVFEFFPAPGQFVNKLPEWKTGDKEQQMADHALASLAQENVVSLGGFGGYVVMGFDHTIINKPGKKNLLILGNAFPNNAEPGVIMVSADVNGNGLPDDEWYEIAGSEYNNPKTIKNYQITYYKPDENKAKVTDPNDTWSSDLQYIRWEDNQGKSGYLTKNVFHDQSYYPLWKGNSITFTGTRLPDDQIKNTSSDPNMQYWVSPAFPWGYVDNVANDDENAKIKLDWAVDKNGKPVKLYGIDFIKVYSSIRKEAGWLGENSTEVGGVRDLNLK
jgi:hypothetical protein